MDRTLIILNPAAHSTRARAATAKIEKLVGDTEVRVTGEPGEARLIAEQAVKEGFETIIAAGGDGTINEIVNGIAKADVTLGLLPVGTMNVFAAELGLPGRDLKKCWQTIQSGNVRKIDLPRANQQYFVQLAGIGFDAQVVKETSWDLKRNIGPLSYVVSAAQIAARKPPPLIIETDEGTREGSFVLVGNGRYYGGPFTIFKNAQIDDGKLDLVIFKNLGYLDIVRYLHAIMFGMHTTLRDVEYLQTKRARVSSTQEVPVEVDGEVVGNLPVTFRCSSRKLKVLAPQPTPQIVTPRSWGYLRPARAPETEFDSTTLAP